MGKRAVNAKAADVDVTAAATGPAEVSWVPLMILEPCRENVRTGKADQAALAQLAEDIAAHGLLQNLVGVQDGDVVRVVAGARRLAALKLLAKAGRWAGAVPVMLLPGGSGALEAGLAENFQRLALHPMDEAQAFNALVEAGHAEAGIAARFGLPVRHVQQRLRLAGLAKPVAAKFRAGEIGLEVAQAFASVPDAARQTRVLKECSAWSLTNPNEIRRAMARGLSATSAVARFLGREDYVAAGGRVVSDLFSDDAAEVWLDEDVLTRAAEAKAERLAAAFKAEWGLGEVFFHMCHSWPDPWSHLKPYEGELADVSAETRAQLLVVLEWDYEDGSLLAEEALWMTEPLDLPVAVAADAPAPEAAPVDEAVVAGPVGLSAVLKDYVAVRRRDSLVAGLGLGRLQPDHVLRILVYCLAVASRPGAFDLGMGLRLDRGHEPASLPDVRPWAGDALDEARGWVAEELAWLKGRNDLSELWRAIWNLGGDVVARLGLALVAHGLHAQGGTAGPAVHQILARFVHAPDVVARWRPDADFFERWGKAGCLSVVGDVLGSAAPAFLARLKRAELAAICAGLMTGDADAVEKIGVVPDSEMGRQVAEAGRQWLPPGAVHEDVTATPAPQVADAVAA